MGKSKPPAFQLYAADFYMDTADWSIEEIGIYTRLLFYQWVNREIPAETNRIARIAGCSKHKLEKAWPVIEKKFEVFFQKNIQLDSDQVNKKNAKKLRNKRMEEVRQKQDDYIKNQTLSGYKGAEKRWPDKTKAYSDPNGDPISKPNGETIALQSSSSSSIIKSIENNKEAPVDNSLSKDAFLEKFKILMDQEIQPLFPMIREFQQIVVFIQSHITEGQTNFDCLMLCLEQLIKAKKNETKEKPLLSAKRYLEKIYDIENGNFNAQDHEKKAAEFKGKSLTPISDLLGSIGKEMK